MRYLLVVIDGTLYGTSNAIMFEKARILETARRSPDRLQFGELCLLAEAFGFTFAKGGDGHVAYHHPGGRSVLTLQDDRGRARAYQVAQLVAAIDDLPNPR